MDFDETARKKEIQDIRQRSEIIIWFCFVDIFLVMISVFFRNYDNAKIFDYTTMILQTLVLVILLIIHIIQTIKLSSFKLRVYINTAFYKKAVSRLGLAFLAIINVSPNMVFYKIIIRQNDFLHKLIIFELAILATIFIIAIIDKVYRGTDEEIGDELSQKIFDEGAKNAFYLIVSGVFAYHITISLWRGLREGLIEVFGNNSIDFTTATVLTIIILSWSIGHYVAKDKYR